MATVRIERLRLRRGEEIRRSTFVLRSAASAESGGRKVVRYRMYVLNERSAEEVRMVVPSGDLEAINVALTEPRVSYH